MDIRKQLSRYGLFDTKVPRYTSYPPANHFDQHSGRLSQRQWLQDIPPTQPVSVYIHIPFCRRICWYCACRTQGTKTMRPVDFYIASLRKELAILRDILPHPLKMDRLHLGGGTPTLLTPNLMNELLGDVFGTFQATQDHEFSVEIDPTECALDTLSALAEHGMNRVSVGIQDFDLAVQNAIGRKQSVAETKRVVNAVRALGVRGVNFDLLYGLPHQNTKTLLETLDVVTSMQPDRLAVFGYAHVPRFSKRQAMISSLSLPTGPQRYELAETARETLNQAGYTSIGIDHFAKPTDTLAVAQAEGRLRRNFQGYTDDASPVLIGLGASAISKFPQGYVQNAVSTTRYNQRIAAGELSGRRGYTLLPDETLRARLIEMLLCNFTINIKEVEVEYPETSDEVYGVLEGISVQYSDAVTFDHKTLSIKPEYRALTRIIAKSIDQFSTTPHMDHSMAS